MNDEIIKHNTFKISVFNCLNYCKAIIVLKCTYNQPYLSRVLLNFKGFTMHLIQMLVHHCHEINST